MSDIFKSSLSHPSARHDPSFFWAALFVMAMHAGLLGMGHYWNPTPPMPKEKQKVIVQTIRLEAPKLVSVAPKTIAPPSSSPIPPKQAEQEAPQMVAEAEAPAQVIETPPVKKESVAPPKKQEPIPDKPKETPKPKEIKKTEPSKKAAPPKAASKPAQKETKKEAPKKTEPKKIEPAKKAAQEPPKAKPKNDAEIKKQKEKAEADQKQKEKAEAESKKQKEKAEAEQKRQKEKAEAEKKLQQEIAAAEAVAREQERALLSKAQENLAKIGQTRDKISSSSTINLNATALPQALGTLQVDALPVDSSGGGSGSWGTKEVSYGGEVASRLKKALCLPDYGAVNIKLTLDRTGKVVKVVIVHSESSKNKAYVESKIPTLLFPPFGQRFKDAAQNTFEVKLQNDS